MTIHKMKLSLIPFEKIANGMKVIESRLYDEKRQKIIVGDAIEFACNEDLNKKILVKVKKLHHYPTFLDMFNNLDINYFDGDSIDELLEEIETFYPKDAQLKYGVIGIEFETSI